MLRRAPEGMSEASAAPTVLPSSRSISAISRSRVPATKTPKQSAMPVRAILQPSEGIWCKLRSATKRPRSRVRELIMSSRIRKACARSSEQSLKAEWPPIQTGVKSRKRVVTENAEFEHHYLAAVATKPIADVSLSSACQADFAPGLRLARKALADVRIIPESGHGRERWLCLFGAKTGRMRS